MNTNSRRFKAVDILLLLGAILPLVACMVLKTNRTNGKKGFNLISINCLTGLKTLVADSFQRNLSAR